MSNHRQRYRLSVFLHFTFTWVKFIATRLLAPFSRGKFIPKSKIAVYDYSIKSLITFRERIYEFRMKFAHLIWLAYPSTKAIFFLIFYDIIFFPIFSYSMRRGTHFSQKENGDPKQENRAARDCARIDGRSNSR